MTAGARGLLGRLATRRESRSADRAAAGTPAAPAQEEMEDPADAQEPKSVEGDTTGEAPSDARRRSRRGRRDFDTELDAALTIERGDALPADLVTETIPLNRRSPFYVGFVGALGVLIAWGLLRELTHLSQVLTFLLVAIFLALGLNPVVEALSRRGLSRGWSVVVVFGALVGLFVLIGLVVVPPVSEQTQALVKSAPTMLTNLEQNRIFHDLDSKYHILSRAQSDLKKQLTSGAAVTSLFGGLLGAGKAIVDGVIGTFTVLILTLYFLATLPRVKAAVYRLVPMTRRTRVVQISEEITRRVGGYVVGQISVALINGLLCFTMLKILTLPYAAVLALTVALLGLVPIVGTLVGGTLVVLVALVDSWQKALIMLAYYSLYHVFDAYILSPRIMKRAVEVPPAVTVVAILAGGAILGVLGALIAIPVAAGLLLIYERVVVPRQQNA